ncbi:MAG: putative quinol monooxygenase [Actinomycetota bacterium]
MSKISLIAKLTAAEGKGAELRALLGALIEAADEEPGLEVYSAHGDPENEDVVYFFELYQDQAAIDVHGKGERMREAMGALGGLLGARPEITMLEPLVAKGLDVSPAS